MAQGRAREKAGKCIIDHPPCGGTTGGPLSRPVYEHCAVRMMNRAFGNNNGKQHCVGGICSFSDDAQRIMDLMATTTMLATMSIFRQFIRSVSRLSKAVKAQGMGRHHRLIRATRHHHAGHKNGQKFVKTNAQPGLPCSGCAFLREGNLVLKKPPPSSDRLFSCLVQVDGKPLPLRPPPILGNFVLIFTIH